MAARSLTLSALSARRLPDENVFDRTLRGDPVAFSEVYRRYQKRVHGYCLARSLDPDTAADATQEVFMKLLRADPGSIQNPRAWLFTVARNVVIDVIRKRSRTPEDAGIDEESLAWDRLRSADTADEVLARSDARNVFLALRTVRPRYRTALIMREVHGQSSADMAEALETTPGAVDTLVSRARDAFGVAYASISGLPSTCRANVELIYRRTGTGITDPEQAALDSHLTECERCRAEAKRAATPRHLGALLPFLLPANRWTHGVLHRAAMTARSFPDVALQPGAVLLTQPQTWNLGTKVAAGLIAAALVTAPIAATTLSHPAAQAPGAFSPAVARPSTWGPADRGPQTTMGGTGSGTSSTAMTGGPSGSGGMHETAFGTGTHTGGTASGTSPTTHNTGTSGTMTGGTSAHSGTMTGTTSGTHPTDVHDPGTTRSGAGSMTGGSMPSTEQTMHGGPGH